MADSDYRVVTHNPDVFHVLLFYYDMTITIAIKYNISLKQKIRDFLVALNTEADLVELNIAELAIVRLQRFKFLMCVDYGVDKYSYFANWFDISIEPTIFRAFRALLNIVIERESMIN